MSAEPAADRVVVGAGIVGLACALTLRRAGHDVVLIERDGVAAGASRGNAGALAYADILPLASPGIVRQAPRWLLDPLGPLALRPAYAPRMLPWLWRFWRASQPARVDASSAAQAALLDLSAQTWPALMAAADASDLLCEGGNLHLYDSQAHWHASLPGWQRRAAHGIAFEHLHGADALAALQSGLSAQWQHATYVPHWHTVRDPLTLCDRLATAFAALGGRFRHGEVRALRPEADGIHLQLNQGSLRAARVVVAAGAWSHRLAATLGESIPLETERGYNTTLPAGAWPLQRQLTFCNHGFVATPINGGVRIGGAVEFAGLDAAPNYARADALLHKAQRFMPGLRTEGGTQWMGLRPSLPDSLPAIGPARADPRVLYAFGHGHLGLTEAAATAACVAALVAGQTPPLDLTAFSAQRF